MQSRRSSSRPDAGGRLALGAFVATLVVATGAPTPARAQTLRPAVTIDVAIEGRTYRSMLGDAASCAAVCQRVRASLVDSVRATLERSFGFLEWRALPLAAPDTLRVAWVNRDRTEDGELQLTMLGRDRRARMTPTRLRFEPFSEIVQRPARDWQDTSAIRTAWLARLRQVLANPSEARFVTTEVLSRVPLKPLVTLSAPDVIVGFSPSVIRADPTKNPVFRIRMYVLDPKDVEPSQARQDTAEVTVDKCSRTGDGRGYRCRMNVVLYPERTPRDSIVAADSVLQLARRARETPVTLHLWQFFPATADDAPLHRPEE